MSSILPKGIVVNTAEISGDIEKIDREPLALEEIAKLWKVYTTTKRRLLDPTAERLENYWWRIWGSRKRDLNGATVARLFADISNGRSFVPLRGPPNRDESGGRPTTFLPPGPRNANSIAIQSGPGVDLSNGQQSSSVSKNPAIMPPPILKKSRGPSATGPRPTARFISPHSSEDEEGIGDASTTSPGAHVVVRPPTPDLETSGREKKVDASITGSRRKARGSSSTNTGQKRRPDVVRRPNSDPASRTGKANETEKREGPLALDSLPVMKLSGKSRSGKSSYSTPSIGRSSTQAFTLADDRGSSSALRSTGNEEQDLSYKNAPQGDEVGLRMEGFRNVGAELKQSESSAEFVQNPSAMRLSKTVDAEGSTPPGLAENTSIGNLDTRSLPTPATTESGMDAMSIGRGEGDDTMIPKQKSLFAKRPVQPVKSASALFTSPSPSELRQSNNPISRSKSQLTLLLERDRARTNEPKDATGSAA